MQTIQLPEGPNRRRERIFITKSAIKEDQRRAAECQVFWTRFSVCSLTGGGRTGGPAQTCPWRGRGSLLASFTAPLFLALPLPRVSKEMLPNAELKCKPVLWRNAAQSYFVGYTAIFLGRVYTTLISFDNSIYIIHIKYLNLNLTNFHSWPLPVHTQTNLSIFSKGRTLCPVVGQPPRCIFVT